MKISIITPVKNSEGFITETIESVINQKGNFEIEYLIIDGYSNDNTLKICKEYERQIEKSERTIFCDSIILKVISESDDGMYAALAKGVQLATGDIISYINGDDFYLPNAFSCVMEIFSKNSQVKWLMGNVITYNMLGHVVDCYFSWQYNSNLILKGFYNGRKLPVIQQESSFWRKECNKVLDYDLLKSYKLAGDYFLWHSFARNNYQLYLVDTLLGGFRRRVGQLSENKEEYFREYNLIKTKGKVLDQICYYFYYLIEQLAPLRLKQKFSKNRIRYKSSGWQVQ